MSQNSQILSWIAPDILTISIPPSPSILTATLKKYVVGMRKFS